MTKFSGDRAERVPRRRPRARSQEDMETDDSQQTTQGDKVKLDENK